MEKRKNRTMAAIRKPFQGIWNVVRFNWHFYLLAVGFVLGILFLNSFLAKSYHIVGYIVVGFVIVIIVISLVVSFYVYDLSNLYKLTWLNHFDTQKRLKIANINAGFDETSMLLIDKFPHSNLAVFDFYNPSKHTEISIKRARKAYRPFPHTQQIETSTIHIRDFDMVFLILAAHEIRSVEERNVFFAELRNALNNDGQIIMVEHLRDLPNFLAYNMGFFHFVSKASWYETFKNSGLVILTEEKITPFITVFTLAQHGVTS